MTAGSSGVAAAADRPRRARELERTPKNELSVAQVLGVHARTIPAIMLDVQLVGAHDSERR
jgi:hypothetical protein